MSFLTPVRHFTDTALDALIQTGVAAGKNAFAEMRAKSRKNLIVTTVLNAALLGIALVAALFASEARKVGIVAISAVNLFLLMRTAVKLAQFIQNPVRRYFYIIRFAVPCFARGIVRLRSCREAVKETIRAVYRYVYQEKLPKPVKFLHPIASVLGIIKSSGDIEEQAVRDFYPLVKSYMLEALVCNFALYSVCYGLFVYIIKNAVFVTMLHMTVPEVLFYPVTIAVTNFL
jgi:hypothetical protein